ncbi:MAG: CpaD family pilus assembly protein [Pseudomonadota bacterium]
MTYRLKKSGQRSQVAALLKTSAAVGAVLMLAACHTSGSSVGTYDPRFVNYEDRHKLTLQQSERNLPLMVGASAHGLTGGDRTALAGFVRSYQSGGEGSLRIRVPQGSANAGAAHRALSDIHTVVARAGGNPSRILVERYHVGNPSAHAPIMVVYDRIAAVTNECGDWSDNFNPPFEQSDYFNYGCATQANLGAMLEDPRDLVRPRGMGRPDAGRRAQVLANYRQGEPTATRASEDAEAAVSEVEQ